MILNVATYKAHPDVLVFASGNGLKNKQLFVNSKDIGVAGVAGYFYLNNQVIFNKWGVNDSFVYKCSDGSIELLTGGRVQNVIARYAIFLDVMSDVFLYRDYSFLDLFTSKYNFKIIGKDYGFDYDDYHVIKVGFEGNVFWQFTISSLGVSSYEPNKPDSIDNIICVANGSLWFYTHSGRLVALDVETGKVVRKISGNLKDKADEYDKITGLGNCFFRESDETIIGISGCNFQVVNTKNFKVNSYNFFESDHSGIGKYENIYSPLLQGDYFTFLAEKREDHGGIRHVGIFDYNAKKLVWEYEVITQEDCKETKSQLIAPEQLYMCSDKLYIKDFNSKLHIFQRER